MKPALQKKGLRLIIDGIDMGYQTRDETCPTEKGIATSWNSFSSSSFTSSLDETCPTEKGIATRVLPSLLHSKLLLRMKPALQKKGLRLFSEVDFSFHCHTSFWWNLPYRKRDCDLCFCLAITRTSFIDETCPTEKGIATHLSGFFFLHTQERWNLPYRKRDCDLSASKNATLCDPFMMKPALQKKGLRLSTLSLCLPFKLLELTRMKPALQKKGLRPFKP